MCVYYEENCVIEHSILLEHEPASMCDRIPKVRDILSVSPAGMTRHNIPEDQNPQIHRCESLKIRKKFFPYCKINGENWTRT